MELRKRTSVEITNERIWGLESESHYCPLELYQRGAKPHLEFVEAEDIKEFTENCGYLAETALTVQGFRAAQGRFRALLNLYRCLQGKSDRELREAYLVAVEETGIVTVPGVGTILGLNLGWELESAQDIYDEVAAHAAPSRERWASIDGKGPFEAAKEFPESASRKALERASEELLEWALVKRLKGIQPDFEHGQRFKPTWTVRDLLQAFYLMLFFDITGAKSIGQCPECGSFFYRFGKRLRFCSGLCGRRNIQRTYWKRRGKFLRRKRVKTQRGGEQ